MLLVGLVLVSRRLRVGIVVLGPDCGKFFLKYCSIPAGATTVTFKVGVAEVIE